MTLPAVDIERRVPAPADRLPDREQPTHVADPAVFTAVFRRFYTPLVRYARRLTGDGASASDVLQDVFAKLWEDRHRITVEVSLQALLYTMVRNRALNLRRRAHRHAPDVDVQDLRDQAGEAPDGSDDAEADELRRHLYRWVSELPPRRAEAFTLSRYHGLSHAEIAALMGVSVRTVDTHILLALRELRRRLDALHQP